VPGPASTLPMERELPYELVEKVSSGLQSVYRAKDKTGRFVSLKTAAKSSLTPDMRERFLREVRICSEFEHPNLVRVEDSGETSEVMYHVTEWLEGMSLSDVLSQQLAMSWDQKLDIMEQVCAGLEYAHSRKIFHRDVKPANIFLESSGRVKLLDFGMARTEESVLTVEGLSPGTLAYMSPEQVRGEQVTEASDVFCAGIVFYEIATGSHPFAPRSANVSTVLSAILFQSPAPLRQTALDAPDGLDLILNQAMEKDAARRFSSARELRQTIALCRTLRSAGVQNGRDAGAGVTISDTLVIDRPRPAAAIELPPTPTPPASAVEKRICPHCTSPNSLDAAVCTVCAMPISSAAAAAEPGTRRTNWVLIASIAGVLLIAVILLVRAVQ
jgi:serine/threonine protein kinase